MGTQAWRWQGLGIVGLGGKAGRPQGLWAAVPSGTDLTGGVTQFAQRGAVLAGWVLPTQGSCALTRLLLAEHSPRRALALSVLETVRGTPLFSGSMRLAQCSVLRLKTPYCALSFNPAEFSKGWMFLIPFYR